MPYLQAYYLAAPFPCERAPTTPLSKQQCGRMSPNLAVSRLAGYPVLGFVVEVLSSAATALEVSVGLREEGEERGAGHSNSGP